MTVTVNNFIEQSVIGVSSKGTHGWRVTGRPEALLDSDAGTSQGDCYRLQHNSRIMQASSKVIFESSVAWNTYILHGVRRPRPTYRWPDARTPCL